MSKNLVNRVRAGWEDLEDVLAVEEKRAKFERISLVGDSGSKGNEAYGIRWAQANAVDDDAINSLEHLSAGHKEYILSLPYSARFTYLKKESARYGHTVRARA